MAFLDNTGLSHLVSKLKTLLSSKANDANVVHKTGDETVGGVKTFTDKIVISNANSYIQYNATTGCIEIFS